MEGACLPDLRTRQAVQGYLRGVATEIGVVLSDKGLALELDRRDQLAPFRSKFNIPLLSTLLEEDAREDGIDLTEESMYLLGNSTGLQPKGACDIVAREMAKWAEKGIEGHFVGDIPWLEIEEHVVADLATLVGARPLEVTIMNTLTVNIHQAMVAFYRPTKERSRILMESSSFPSDCFAVQSQVRWHGYDPDTTIVTVTPREGETVWRTEDIVRTIEEQGDSIALVWLAGVHYGTGHLFDMKTITEAAHKKGCYVGFDLAHAAGNVPLYLHDWDVDVAAWCTYKYLNAGPGSIGGFFVHERHAHNMEIPRLMGWWCHKRDTRLQFTQNLELAPGAEGFQLSNPPVLPAVCLRASLDVFKQTSLEALALKSRILTGYIELLLEEYLSQPADGDGGGGYVKVVTSQDPAKRGCQLSLHVSLPLADVRLFLKRRGVVVDVRGSIMRLAPVPLYNSFHDLWRFFSLLKTALGRP